MFYVGIFHFCGKPTFKAQMGLVFFFFFFFSNLIFFNLILEWSRNRDSDERDGERVKKERKYKRK